MPKFYEFFAGGGMARAGLGADWECLFANDFDHKKGVTYRRNWGERELVTADVRSLNAAHLPSRANLIWGSFPCQDLSLAGAGAGLKGDRSGTFWPFWEIVKDLVAEGRGPEIIALENVVGTLHSHSGKDFATICSALHRIGYNVGAMVIDAALFVPQSRPRLFFIGVKDGIRIPDRVKTDGPSPVWHSRTLVNAQAKLSPKLRQSWIWWAMPAPRARATVFADYVEDNPTGVTWHSHEQTRRLIAMMSEINLEKLNRAVRISKDTGERLVGAIYKRTRLDEQGCKVQRAEVRFDEVAGCLRTPAGGSSRQLIVVVDRKSVRSRLISSRETARLMGLPDKYVLPKNYNEAYHLTGDGVAVPVVRHIAKSIFVPILNAPLVQEQIAA